MPEAIGGAPPVAVARDSASSPASAQRPRQDDAPRPDSAIEAAPPSSGAGRLLRERRSSRQFSACPLPEQVVSDIIAHAAWAPSGGNAQPWRVAVLRPRAVKRFLECVETESLYLIEPMIKLALIQMAEREQRPTQPLLNDFVVSKVAPSLRMGDAPPSHIVVVYYERKGVIRRLRDIGHGMALAWHRVWRSAHLGQGLQYIRLMLSNFVRLLGTDDAVQAMSLSNFVYAITLAAQSRAVDSCIQCQFVVLQSGLRQILALERRYEVFACVSLGYPRNEQRDPAATRFPTARYPVPTTWID
ncbi:MAG TPA: nitroreductase family protein [Polyangiaceae bacterium]|nr:nitroreductase family protein [Polyangiaceae bacterium]